MHKKPDVFNVSQSLDEYASDLYEYNSQFDFLGQAATKLKESIFAKRNGDLSKAWIGFNQVKELYLRHAELNKFTANQVAALDSSVSEHLADILRLEGRHEDALLHIAHWVASNEHPTKKQMQKLSAYFKRCKFNNVEYDELLKLINSLPKNDNFSTIKARIKSWMMEIS